MYEYREAHPRLDDCITAQRIVNECAGELRLVPPRVIFFDEASAGDKVLLISSIDISGCADSANKIIYLYANHTYGDLVGVVAHEMYHLFQAQSGLPITECGANEYKKRVLERHRIASLVSTKGD